MDRKPLHLVVILVLALVATIKIMDIVRDLGSIQVAAEPAPKPEVKQVGALSQAKASRDKIVDALK